MTLNCATLRDCCEFQFRCEAWNVVDRVAWQDLILELADDEAVYVRPISCGGQSAMLLQVRRVLGTSCLRQDA